MPAMLTPKRRPRSRSSGKRRPSAPPSMPKVFWADRPKTLIEGLPAAIRREIERREALLRSFPEMYAVVQSGRYRGKRRFTVGRQYSVYGDERDCFITDVVPARARP